MNTTKLEGQTQSLSGSVKEGIGKLTGDDRLQVEGAADQAEGDAKQVIGSAKDAVTKAKTFAKDRPWATAALVGTIGLALINTLRGKKIRG